MKKALLIGCVVLGVLFFFLEEGSGPIVSQNGISTYKLADDIMKKYDRNSDGKLDVNGESFLRTDIDNVRKSESRGLLFTDSDKLGNNDGSVSKMELEAYLKKFDTDGDGELTTFKNVFDSIFSGKSEWSHFDAQYGERYKYEEMAK